MPHGVTNSRKGKAAGEALPTRITLVELSSQSHDSPALPKAPRRQLGSAAAPRHSGHIAQDAVLEHPPESRRGPSAVAMGGDAVVKLHHQAAVIGAKHRPLPPCRGRTSTKVEPQNANPRSSPLPLTEPMRFASASVGAGARTKWLGELKRTDQRSS
ncbi:hypothetical protein [Candidatus Poriferisodalis sp.]|uniref:hypothetical protein n=1 Tax=Candidatus Poriferisodalis sp. TaxID=3101277 RepID=UPI003B023674